MHITAYSDEVSIIIVEVEVTADISLRPWLIATRRKIFSTQFATVLLAQVRWSLDHSNKNGGAPCSRRIRDSEETCSGDLLHVRRWTPQWRLHRTRSVRNFDAILGSPWLRKYEPWISLQHRYVQMTALFIESSDERLRAFKTTWMFYEGDCITCESIIRTTTRPQ